MKNAIIFIFVLILVGAILEMKNETTYEMNEHWEDQTIFQINREGREPIFSYSNRKH